MKHLYAPNNLKNLLNQIPAVFTKDNLMFSSEVNRDFFLLSALSSIENDDNEEPDNNIVEFLFNYSKSLDVISTNFGENYCVFSKN